MKKVPKRRISDDHLKDGVVDQRPHVIPQSPSTDEDMSYRSLVSSVTNIANYIEDEASDDESAYLEDEAPDDETAYYASGNFSPLLSVFNCGPEIPANGKNSKDRMFAVYQSVQNGSYGCGPDIPVDGNNKKKSMFAGNQSSYDEDDTTFWDQFEEKDSCRPNPAFCGADPEQNDNCGFEGVCFLLYDYVFGFGDSNYNHNNVSQSVGNKPTSPGQKIPGRQQNVAVNKTQPFLDKTTTEENLSFEVTYSGIGESPPQPNKTKPFLDIMTTAEKHEATNPVAGKRMKWPFNKPLKKPGSVFNKVKIITTELSNGTLTSTEKSDNNNNLPAVVVTPKQRKELQQTNDGKKDSVLNKLKNITTGLTVATLSSTENGDNNNTMPAAVFTPAKRKKRHQKNDDIEGSVLNKVEKIITTGITVATLTSNEKGDNNNTVSAVVVAPDIRGKSHQSQVLPKSEKKLADSKPLLRSDSAKNMHLLNALKQMQQQEPQKIDDFHLEVEQSAIKVVQVARAEFANQRISNLTLNIVDDDDDDLENEFSNQRISDLTFGIVDDDDDDNFENKCSNQYTCNSALHEMLDDDNDTVNSEKDLNSVSSNEYAFSGSQRQNYLSLLSGSPVDEKKQYNSSQSNEASLNNRVARVLLPMTPEDQKQLSQPPNIESAYLKSKDDVRKIQGKEERNNKEFANTTDSSMDNRTQPRNDENDESNIVDEQGMLLFAKNSSTPSQADSISEQMEQLFIEEEEDLFEECDAVHETGLGSDDGIILDSVVLERKISSSSKITTQLSLVSSLSSFIERTSISNNPRRFFGGGASTRKEKWTKLYDIDEDSQEKSRVTSDSPVDDEYQIKYDDKYVIPQLHKMELEKKSSAPPIDRTNAILENVAESSDLEYFDEEYQKKNDDEYATPQLHKTEPEKKLSALTIARSQQQQEKVAKSPGLEEGGFTSYSPLDEGYQVKNDDDSISSQYKKIPEKKSIGFPIIRIKPLPQKSAASTVLFSLPPPRATKTKLAEEVLSQSNNDANNNHKDDLALSTHKNHGLFEKDDDESTVAASNVTPLKKSRKGTLKRLKIVQPLNSILGRATRIPFSELEDDEDDLLKESENVVTTKSPFDTVKDSLCELNNVTESVNEYNLNTLNEECTGTTEQVLSDSGSHHKGGDGNPNDQTIVTIATSEKVVIANSSEQKKALLLNNGPVIDRKVVIDASDTISVISEISIGSRCSSQLSSPCTKTLAFRTDKKIPTAASHLDTFFIVNNKNVLLNSTCTQSVRTGCYSVATERANASSKSCNSIKGKGWVTTMKSASSGEWRPCGGWVNMQGNSGKETDDSLSIEEILDEYIPGESELDSLVKSAKPNFKEISNKVPLSQTIEGDYTKKIAADDFKSLQTSSPDKADVRFHEILTESQLPPPPPSHLPLPCKRRPKQEASSSLTLTQDSAEAPAIADLIAAKAISSKKAAISHKPNSQAHPILPPSQLPPPPPPSSKRRSKREAASSRTIDSEKVPTLADSNHKAMTSQKSSFKQHMTQALQLPPPPPPVQRTSFQELQKGNQSNMRHTTIHKNFPDFDKSDAIVEDKNDKINGSGDIFVSSLSRIFASAKEKREGRSAETYEESVSDDSYEDKSHDRGEDEESNMPIGENKGIASNLFDLVRCGVRGELPSAHLEFLRGDKESEEKQQKEPGISRLQSLTFAMFSCGSDRAFLNTIQEEDDDTKRTIEDDDDDVWKRSKFQTRSAIPQVKKVNNTRDEYSDDDEISRDTLSQFFNKEAAESMRMSRVRSERLAAKKVDSMINASILSNAFDNDSSQFSQRLRSQSGRR